jgi:hypothetical protein
VSEMDSLYAAMDIADVRNNLANFVKYIIDNGCTPEDHAAILAWIPKVRKVVEEIDAVIQVKTPTMDDELRTVLELGEWNPERHYVVVTEMTEYDRKLNIPTAHVRDGRGVKEMLDREHHGIAHIYLVNEDGTLTQKR